MSKVLELPMANLSRKRKFPGTVLPKIRAFNSTGDGPQKSTNTTHESGDGPANLTAMKITQKLA